MSNTSLHRRSHRRRSTVIVAAGALVITSLVGVAAPTAVAAPAAAYTAVNTDADGSGHCQNGDGDVNCNIYDGKQFVWLNAGPLGAQLDPGGYFFAIVASGGQSDPNDGSPDLLSTDAYTERSFTVEPDFDVVYNGTTHDFDALPTEKIRLVPFDDSPNGVYHLQVCKLASDGSQPAKSDCKSDAFKVPPDDGGGGTVNSLFSGHKYDDANGDGALTPGEAGLASWQINISLNGTPEPPVTTDSSGLWSYSSPASEPATGTSTYTFCEEGQLGWSQTGPDAQSDYDSANALGGAAVTVSTSTKCYSVEVPNNSNASASELNFFNTDSVSTTLSGSKWLDGDGNGVGESKLSGWSISISSGGNPVTGSPVQTDSNGDWTFTTPDRPNGAGTTDFTVCETQQTSWAQTGPAANATPVVGTGTSTIVDSSKCYVVTADDDADTAVTALDFFNQPQGQLSGAKYYDGDTNGTRAGTAGAAPWTEAGIATWQIEILDSASTVVATLTADSNGDFSSAYLPPGTYTVRERAAGSPAGTAWMQTGNTTSQSISTGGATVNLAGFVYTVVIPATAPSTATQLFFGNVCTIRPGGHTLGFWSNKNGQKLTTQADVDALRNDFTLRNANGSEFNPTLKTQLPSWLTSGTAKNMANMLSVQLTATYLSVQHGFTNPDVVVDGTMTVSQLITYANSLLANPIAAGTFAGQNGSNTTAASALRTEQARVKDILDKINNNGSFAQATGAACGTPTFS